MQSTKLLKIYKLLKLYQLHESTSRALNARGRSHETSKVNDA